MGERRKEGVQPLPSITKALVRRMIEKINKGEATIWSEQPLLGAAKFSSQSDLYKFAVA